MKHSSYSYGVHSLVGELRFKHHRTCEEIADASNERGVVTSERYQMLSSASLDDYVRQCMAEITAQNGEIILSMDGVQPEKGNEMLYVIREVFSGTILAARNMKIGAAAELRTLIDPIIEMGYPIVGIVSDGQVSIWQAFESLLPDVPYQYCQYQNRTLILCNSSISHKLIVIVPFWKLLKMLIRTGILLIYILSSLVINRIMRLLFQ
ncbi:hypothetical protein BK133_20885 [Paenibacillus sp. FSL H8-0548]|uniref:hypothetical protein n=1 Tax=Paenibacillus sp. FSL H8-0548 TaxID=1920422 RepID=UPI00096CB7ED|nr:hypothetical protein [Paenibacillus sp. FSL H8-0548]OMF25781.1 hypothetical protein BK133_20885 [Paenibacillus sp. FSL H8-0548]